MLHEHRRTRKPASNQMSACSLHALACYTQVSAVGPAKPTGIVHMLVEVLRSPMSWDVAGRRTPAVRVRPLFVLGCSSALSAWSKGARCPVPVHNQCAMGMPLSTGARVYHGYAARVPVGIAQSIVIGVACRPCRVYAVVPDSIERSCWRPMVCVLLYHI